MTDYENTKETKIDHSHFKVSMVHLHRYLHTQYTTHLRQYVHVTICNHHHRFTRVADSKATQDESMHTQNSSFVMLTVQDCE